MIWLGWAISLLVAFMAGAVLDRLLVIHEVERLRLAVHELLESKIYGKHRNHTGN